MDDDPKLLLLGFVNHSISILRYLMRDKWSYCNWSSISRYDCIWWHHEQQIFFIWFGQAKNNNENYGQRDFFFWCDKLSPCNLSYRKKLQFKLMRSLCAQKEIQSKKNLEFSWKLHNLVKLHILFAEPTDGFWFSSKFVRFSFLNSVYQTPLQCLSDRSSVTLHAVSKIDAATSSE